MAQVKNIKFFYKATLSLEYILENNDFMYILTKVSIKKENKIENL